MSASLQLPGGLLTLNPQPEIARYYNVAGLVYASTAQIISEIVPAVRYVGQTFLVGNTEYWFNPTTADADLKPKINPGSLTGTGTVNRVPKFGTISSLVDSSITNTASLVTIANPTVITGVSNALAGIARGVYINTTSVATANNDLLIGLDINPTFTVGAFTGVQNIGIRSAGNIQPSVDNTYNLGSITNRFNISYVRTMFTSTVVGNTALGLSSGNSIAPLLFQSNTGLSTNGQIFGTTGNWVLQKDGTFTDNGVDRLQVSGSIIADAYKIKNAPTTSAGTYDILTRNTGTGVVEKVPSNTYITTTAPAGGELSGTYPNPLLVNNAVTGKVLTGFTAVGGAILATDTILQAFGKAQGQINGLIGGVRYLGLWDANTNTPTLSNGSGTQGDLYIVNVAGATSLDGITPWAVGDRVYRNATVWTRPPADVDVVGGGVPNYVARWDSVSTLTTGLIYDDGIHVGIGTSTFGTERLKITPLVNSNGINIILPAATGVAPDTIYIETNGTDQSSSLVTGAAIIMNNLYNAGIIVVGEATSNNSVGFRFWRRSGTPTTNRAFEIYDSPQAKTTYRVDQLGNVFAQSYVKDGGLSTQYLMADGSVSTGGGGSLTGSGTPNAIPKWGTATSLVDSPIVTAAGVVAIRETATILGKDNVVGQHFLAVAHDSSSLNMQASLAGTGPANISMQVSGGNIGIGPTTAFYNKLTVTTGSQDGTSSAHGFGVQTSDTGMVCYTYVNDANETSNIQSGKRAVGNRALNLNPAGGNVGIGTPNPIAKTHSVTGIVINKQNPDSYSAWFSNEDRLKGVIIGYDSATNSGVISSINKDVAWTNLLINPNGGNVDIGGFNVNAKLGVNGSIWANDILLGHQGQISSISTAEVNQTLKLGGTDAITFETYQSGWFERMRISINGNVGIGTTFPQQPFVVSANATIGMEVYLDTGAGMVGIQAYNRSTVAYTHMNLVAKNILFSIDGIEKGRVNSSGNLLIGTAVDNGFKLRVAGNGWFQGNVQVGTTASGTGGNLTIQGDVSNGVNGYQGALFMNNGISTEMWSINQGEPNVTQDGLSIRRHSANSTAMYIDSNNNTTFRAGLTVSGGITGGHIIGKATGSTFTTGSFEAQTVAAGDLPTYGFHKPGSFAATIRQINGTSFDFLSDTSVYCNLYAGAFFTNSDIRLKTIVEPIHKNPIDLKAISFTWNDNRDDKVHIGYSAQEVQEFIPEAVYEGTDGKLLVDYIQVLVAKVASLEKRIQELENR